MTRPEILRRVAAYLDTNLASEDKEDLVPALQVWATELDGQREWRKCTMHEAITHASKRTPRNDNTRRGAPGDYYVVSFTDDTAIACCSQWSGPYSDVTPDVDADEPEWMILS